jgi:NNP family nitrate/nitrite transporter-like MFS transporter
MALAVALAFVRYGRGGRSLGQAPDLGLLRDLAGSPTMWLMLAVFALSVGSSIGAYTMLPLYLVAGHGLPQDQANAYVALSRILSSGTAFASGYLIDRLGAFKALRLFLLTSGLATLGLGLASGTGLLIFLFLQPQTTVCLFPAAFAALAQASEERLRGLAVSIVVPPGVLLGSGGVPTFIGWMGDLGLFGLGFAVLGGLALILVLVLRRQVYTRPGKP